MSLWCCLGLLSAVNIALFSRIRKLRLQFFLQFVLSTALMDIVGGTHFSRCALWHHIHLRNLQNRLQVQVPGLEMHAITVLFVAGTVPLLKSKSCFWPYDFVFLNIKHHSWVSHGKNTSAQKVLRRSLHFSRAATLKISEIGKYYDIKMLEARGVYHNHKKLIPDFNHLIKEAFTLIY